MTTFPLEIATPIRLTEISEVTYLRCPGLEGLFGVMAKHAPALIAMGVGEIKITSGGRDRYLATSGGYAEISTGRVQLLLETAEEKEMIDVERAEASRRRAAERLAVRAAEIDRTRAVASLTRALNRLNVATR